jgi:hypothetical protein
MTAALALSESTAAPAAAADECAPVLDVVVPVYNEEVDPEPCVRRLHAYLTASFPYRFRITVVDNASTDATLAVANRLAGQLPGVTVRHLGQKGRGGALRVAWSASPAPVLAYVAHVGLFLALGTVLGAQARRGRGTRPGRRGGGARRRQPRRYRPAVPPPARLGLRRGGHGPLTAGQHNVQTIAG